MDDRLRSVADLIASEARSRGIPYEDLSDKVSGLIKPKELAPLTMRAQT